MTTKSIYDMLKSGATADDLSKDFFDALSAAEKQIAEESSISEEDAKRYALEDAIFDYLYAVGEDNSVIKLNKDEAYEMIADLLDTLKNTISTNNPLEGLFQLFTKLYTN